MEIFWEFSILGFISLEVTCVLDIRNRNIRMGRLVFEVLKLFFDCGMIVVL